MSIIIFKFSNSQYSLGFFCIQNLIHSCVRTIIGFLKDVKIFFLLIWIIHQSISNCTNNIIIMINAAECQLLFSFKFSTKLGIFLYSKYNLFWVSIRTIIGFLVTMTLEFVKTCYELVRSSPFCSRVPNILEENVYFLKNQFLASFFSIKFYYLNEFIKFA